ncbi:hypothetical protein AC578_6992 [Pseudocercospora eumusae]|uniref:Uncharacterized protein n=1 Tax=Pseudocercospora eumusae TaxID=321146 RepID=A0A139GZB1_9PEZI|nr:hypothetical protein AC578_6992 [Pseudocercospora eumusae]
MIRVRRDCVRTARQQWSARRSVHKPSLVEQLFPEESKKYQDTLKLELKPSREIPRLPLDLAESESPQIAPAARSRKHDNKTFWQRKLEAERLATAPGTSVLVLRNATKNLTEDDFRRLIPRGKHIEGWTLEQGHIQQVIPRRHIDTLAHATDYYILFSSALSAFTYQGHVTRIHRLAARHTPNNTASTIPPPPGYMLEGIDVQSAIQAYALVPPNQKLELRQLKPPLAPMMSLIVNNRGYPPLVKRKDKMPYEARLTMDGPQLQPSVIRHIIMDDGKRRGLSWSGGDNFDLKITRWELEKGSIPSEEDRSEWAERWAQAQETAEKRPSLRAPSQTSKAETTGKELPRRTPGHVFVVGFHSENAAQSFIAHWHRRPLCRPGASEADAMAEDGDLPPIANLEMLW